MLIYKQRNLYLVVLQDQVVLGVPAVLVDLRIQAVLAFPMLQQSQAHLHHHAVQAIHQSLESLHRQVVQLRLSDLVDPTAQSYPSALPILLAQVDLERHQIQEDLVNLESLADLGYLNTEMDT